VVLDTRVSVTLDDAALLGDADRLLAPFVVRGDVSIDASVAYAVATDPDRHGLLVGRVGHPGRPVDRQHALSWLLADVNACALDGYDGFAAHAGVVVRDGRAACFPGDSGAGKSTLVAACVAAGLDYASDEALCLDRSSGHVVPYPRPIALAADSVRLVTGRPAPGEHLLTADDLGGHVVEAPTMLTDVVLFEREAGPPRLEPLESADAMAALLSRSFNLYRDPEGLLELVASAVRRARPWRLRYDEPSPAAALIAEHLG
jgi:hypothetical protein